MISVEKMKLYSYIVKAGGLMHGCESQVMYEKDASTVSARFAQIDVLALALTFLILLDILPGLLGTQLPPSYRSGYLDVKNFEPEGNPIRQYIILAFSAYFLFRLITRAPFGVTRSVGLPLAALLMACGLSSLWSFNPVAVLIKTAGLYASAVVALYSATCMSYGDSAKSFRSASNIAVISSILYGIATSWAYDYNGDLRGLFIHKNSLGVAAALSLMFNLSSIKHSPSPAQFTNISRLLQNSCMVVISVATLLLANSATELLCSVVIGYLWIVMSLKNKSLRALYLLGGASGIAAMAFVAVSGPEVLSALVGRSLTLSGRTTVWSFTLDMIYKEPALGYGYGVFWLGQSAPGALFWYLTKQYEMHTHNGYLQFTLETGLVGLFLLILSILNGFYKLFLNQSRLSAGIPNIYFLVLVFFVLVNITEPHSVVSTSPITFLFLYVCFRGNFVDMMIRKRAIKSGS